MYNKLFTKILDSSIWLEPTPTRIVWITLIAAMDQDGYAHFSAIENLARRAGVTLEECNAAVTSLTSPDGESGDPDHEGRRIERVPGGYFILNAEKYRDIVTTIVRREQTKKRVREWREKNSTKPSVTQCNAKKQNVTLSSVYVSDTEKGESEGKTPFENEIPKILQTDEFKALWRDWVTLRRAGKKMFRPDLAFRRQLKDMEEWGLESSLESLKAAIRGSHDGLYPPKNRQANKPKKKDFAV